MSIYRENLNISVEQWIELLQDSSIFKDDDINLIKELYSCEKRREKASILATILGVSSHSVLNLQIGRLGKRIINRLPHVKFPTRDNGTIRYWHIPFYGEDAEKRGQYFWELRPELQEAIKMLLNKSKFQAVNIEENTPIALEIPEQELKDLFEGAKKQIIINAYERNPKARQLCIKKYGYKCCVCGFEFKDFYGDIGIGYIEVHHIKPLNEINKKYTVDPVNDLRPICPNCHSMLHRSNISIDSLRAIVQKNRKN